MYDFQRRSLVSNFAEHAGAAMIGAATLAFVAMYVAPARGDDLLVPMIFSNSVDVIDPVTGVDRGPLISGLGGPSAIAVAADGSIYVSQAEAYPAPAVLHYSASGNLLGPLTPAGGEPIFSGSGGGVRIGADGTIYVSDFGASGGNSLFAFSPAGVPEGVLVTGLTGGSGIAVGSSGNVYVADFGTQGVLNSGKIVKYNGTSQSDFVLPGTNPGQTQFMNLDGLLLLPNGKLLAGDLSLNDILEFNSDGSFDKVFATLAPMPGPPFFSNAPGGMTLLPDGQHILVSALGYTDPPGVTGELLVYDLDGNQVGNPIATGLAGSSDVAYLSSASWNFNGDGNFSSIGKWSSGALPSGVCLTVTFGTGTSTPVTAATATVTIDGDYTAGTLAFNNSTTKYTLASAASGSSSITLANLGAGASVTVAAGSQTPDIQTALILSDSGGTTFNIAGGAALYIDPNGGSIGENSALNPGQKLILTGGGLLQIAGPTSYSGGTTVRSGTLQIDSTGSLGGALALNATGGASAVVKLSNNQADSQFITLNSITSSTDGSLGSSATLNIAAGATLESSGAVSNTGTLKLTGGGTLQADEDVSGAGSLVVDAGSSLTARQIKQNALSISGSATVTLNPSGSGNAAHPARPNNVNFSSTISSLSLGGTTDAWTGTLDIGNNGLVIAYGAGTDPFTMITNMVKSGYANGNWTGTGITSSLARAAALLGSPTPALNIGLIDFVPNTGTFGSSISFEGQTITTSAVLVRLTYMDDLVLSGDMAQANATSDALFFAANYGSGTTWGVGDLTHNGVIDTNDALLFAANYVVGLPSLDGPPPQKNTV